MARMRKMKTTRPSIGGRCVQALNIIIVQIKKQLFQGSFNWMRTVARTTATSSGVIAAAHILYVPSAHYSHMPLITSHINSLFGSQNRRAVTSHYIGFWNLRLWSFFGVVSWLGSWKSSGLITESIMDDGEWLERCLLKGVSFSVQATTWTLFSLGHLYMHIQTNASLTKDTHCICVQVFEDASLLNLLGSSVEDPYLNTCLCRTTWATFWPL